MRRNLRPVIMESDVDFVFVGELVKEVELFGLGFANECLDAHFVSEFKELAAGGFVGGYGLCIIDGHADSC